MIDTNIIENLKISFLYKGKQYYYVFGQLYKIRYKDELKYKKVCYTIKNVLRLKQELETELKKLMRLK